MSKDIVIDSLQTLAEILRREGATVLPSHMSEAERIVKAAWGGDRPYISLGTEMKQRELIRRNAEILRDWQHGERVPLLARRYGLAERTVHHIINGTRPADPPAMACLSDCASSDGNSRNDPDRTDIGTGVADGRRHRKVAKDPA